MAGMGRLVYSITASLDGYIADEHGDFGFTAPSEQVHSFVNDRMRQIGTFLFGRRLYETMRVWDELELELEGQPGAMAEFARFWHGTDKVVFSASLESVDMRRTRLERRFDVDEVRAMVEASDRDVAIGGPTLAADAMRAGIVDEITLYLAPVVIGGGTRALPDDAKLDLDLVDERRFDDGTVFVSYRVVR